MISDNFGRSIPKQFLAKNNLKGDDFYFTFLEIFSDMKLFNY